MNKKGQAIMFKIMMGIFLFVFVVVTIPFMKELISEQRTDLGCGGGGLTVGQSSMCVLLDFQLFYVMGTLLLIGIGYITYNKIVVRNEG